MKQFTKKIIKSSFFSSLLAGLVWLYIKLVFYTGRWRVEGLSKIQDKDKPLIFAFWHGRLLMIPQFAKKVGKCNVIISHHSDGELIAKAVGLFGIGLVRGSPKKDGSKALLEMRQKIEAGENIVFTPDGPRGPRAKSKEGVLFIAQKLGLNIVPVSFSARRKKVFSSWDKFMLPYPFTSGIVMLGDVVKVNSKTSLAQIDKAINRVTEQADKNYA